MTTTHVHTLECHCSVPTYQQRHQPWPHQRRSSSRPPRLCRGGCRTPVATRDSCVRYSGETARYRTLLSSSMDLELRARRRLTKHMRFLWWYELRDTLTSLGHGRTSECSMDGSPLAGLVRHPDLGQFFKHGTVADFVDFVHNYAYLRCRGAVRARQHALTGAPTL